MEVLEETRQLLLATLRAHVDSDLPDARAVVLLAREIRALSSVEELEFDEEPEPEPTLPIGRRRRKAQPAREEPWRSLRRDTIKELERGNTPPSSGARRPSGSA